jgi:flagellar basal body rod protein FlgB
MSSFGFDAVEAGLAFGRARAVVLATDAANAQSQGFRAVDIAPAGERFNGLVVRALGSGGAAGTIERAMAASAQNSVRYRALADQERAMLREFRSAADGARR